MPIEPDQQQLDAIVAVAGGDGDGPVVMLNLNRYRERAAYEADLPAGIEADVSGREAYGRYGEVAQRILERVGARILWYAPSDATVIGDESDVFDEVIAVWYPSRAAFVSLATAEEVVPALVHRRAGLERAALICCASGPDAELGVG